MAPVDPEDAQDTLLNAEQAASMQVLNSAGFAKGETGESGLSEKVQKQGRQRKVCLRLLGGLFGLAALAGAAVGLSLWLQNREAFMGSARENHSSPSAGSAPSITKRNVILMISDGFGPASETLARDYVQALGNGGPETMLALDSILVGSSRTQSSSSYVTDSAAGATAFSCAMKSYNGAIAVDPRQNPCGTVLESAKALGYKTGLVATSRITHATPASFAAHVPFRDMEVRLPIA